MSLILNKLQQDLGLCLPSPLQQIDCKTFLNHQDISVYCKRDDLIHPVISGNKWRKLRPFAELAVSHKIKRVLSFGGGYSNHIHALAYVCKHLGIDLVAVIRGDYSSAPTPMLQDIKAWGATVAYVSKLDYQRRNESRYLNALKKDYALDTIIPEGGSDSDCLTGVASLVDEYMDSLEGITHLVLPIASGGTMAGVIARHQARNLAHSHAKQAPMPKIIGIGVLKGQRYLKDMLLQLLGEERRLLPLPHWHIEHEYHHGGYAKSSPELAQFLREFENNTAIPTEKVYSGKCFFALHKLIVAQTFPAKSKVLAIHTGGLQSRR